MSNNLLEKNCKTISEITNLMEELNNLLYPFVPDDSLSWFTDKDKDKSVDDDIKEEKRIYMNLNDYTNDSSINVNKYRDDGFVAFIYTLFNQRGVSLVNSTHGRHKTQILFAAHKLYKPIFV